MDKLAVAAHLDVARLCLTEHAGAGQSTQSGSVRALGESLAAREALETRSRALGLSCLALGSTLQSLGSPTYEKLRALHGHIVAHRCAISELSADLRAAGGTWSEVAGAAQDVLDECVATLEQRLRKNKM